MEEERVIYFAEPMSFPRIILYVALFLPIVAFFLYLMITNSVAKNIFFSMIFSLLVIGVLELIYREKFRIKIEFFQNYFSIEDKKFQYIDIESFEFENRKIVFHIKHYKKVISLYFLDEFDGNEFAFEIQKRLKR